MRGITEERLKDIKENYNQGGTSRGLIEYLLDDECTELNAWQPIETAPKDRRVILYLENYGWFTGKWRLGQFFCDASLIVPCNIYPTHWQELPDDPK